MKKKTINFADTEIKRKKIYQYIRSISIKKYRY